jgi:hypothetical protein
MTTTINRLLVSPTTRPISSDTQNLCGNFPDSIAAKLLIVAAKFHVGIGALLRVGGLLAIALIDPPAAKRMIDEQRTRSKSIGEIELLMRARYFVVKLSDHFQQVAAVACLAFICHIELSAWLSCDQDEFRARGKARVTRTVRVRGKELEVALT